jgi:hypothetical protein
MITVSRGTIRELFRMFREGIDEIREFLAYRGNVR